MVLPICRGKLGIPDKSNDFFRLFLKEWKRRLEMEGQGMRQEERGKESGEACAGIRGIRGVTCSCFETCFHTLVLKFHQSSAPGKWSELGFWK